MVFDFSSFPVITTERLRLRQLTVDDVEEVMQISGTAEMLRFINNPPVDTPEKALDLINWLNRNFDRHESIEWGITLHSDDKLIGMCGSHDWNRSDRHVDIGYQILPSYWGQGYATEALRAMIRWCFENYDVHRIQGDCTEGNIASEAVMLKCGFTVEGIWRESCWEHGRFVNIKQFGLLRREFESQ